ncbi:MAG TPA: hypothetical protein VK663_09700 [Burkholderiales bacterium]|nr:hypothetical protein [Burkholderiales bacterium]
MIELTHVDLPELAETFADRIGNSTADGHHVRVELLVTRPDRLEPPHLPTAKTYRVARMILTMDCAMALHRQLALMFDALAKQGALKSVDHGPNTKQ